MLPESFFFIIIRFVSQLLNVPGIFFPLCRHHCCFSICSWFPKWDTRVFRNWLLTLMLTILVPAGKHIRLSLFIIAKIQTCNCRQWNHAAQIFPFKGHLANLACMRHRNKHTGRLKCRLFSPGPLFNVLQIIFTICVCCDWPEIWFWKCAFDLTIIL